jgi:hypothetical protein
VPEKLRLEQLLGQRRAVHGDERAITSRRRPMNESGDDFLASSRFAGQENGGLGRRNLCG